MPPRWGNRRWLTRLWGLRLALWQHGPAPLKGLTDHPAYQWWRDPTFLQPDSWWGAAQNEEMLETQVRLMGELGVQLFRVELPWRAVAPDRPGGDRYDGAAARDPAWPGYCWERLDLIARLVEQAGILLVPQVVFAPEWSTGVPATRTGGATAPPGAPEHIADLLTALVERYRGRVRYWELWNEPDHPHAWGGTLRQYVDLVLAPGAAAIRAADATCRVLPGGLANYRSLAALYEAGGGGWFDISNVHLYPRRASVGQVRLALRAARAEMVRSGDASKPLWLTECGLATQPPSTPSHFGGVASEECQARFIRALYRSAGAEAIFFYQLRDTIIFDAANRPLKQVYWGLLSRDLARRKPGFEAYRQVMAAPLVDTAEPMPRTPLRPQVHR
jgi:hypothetical protein